MSFWRNFYHIVWGTKNREELIHPDIEPRLFNYLVRKAVQLEVYCYAVNGWRDHVHIVIAIPPKHSVAYVVKVLKGSSSYYVSHELSGNNTAFSWQRGYGCLSIGKTQLARAITYVHDQKKHHAENSTNRWLEHCSDFIEGPTEKGILLKKNELSIKDFQVSYDVGESDWLF